MDKISFFKIMEHYIFAPQKIGLTVEVVE